MGAILFSSQLSFPFSSLTLQNTREGILTLSNTSLTPNVVGSTEYVDKIKKGCSSPRAEEGVPQSYQGSCSLQAQLLVLAKFLFWGSPRY